MVERDAYGRKEEGGEVDVETVYTGETSADQAICGSCGSELAES